MAIYKVNSKYVDNEIINDAFDDVIEYCLRPDKTPDCYIRGHCISIKNPSCEMKTISDLYLHHSGRRLRHSVLSFAPNEHITHSEADMIAAEIMDSGLYDGHQMLSAVHEDTDEVHIHFILNITNFKNGSKYPSTKESFYSE